MSRQADGFRAISERVSAFGGKLSPILLLLPLVVGVSKEPNCAGAVVEQCFLRLLFVLVLLAGWLSGNGRVDDKFLNT